MIISQAFRRHVSRDLIKFCKWSFKFSNHLLTKTSSLYFNLTPLSTMTGTYGNLLSGRELSKQIQKELQEEVAAIKEKHPTWDPVLVIVQVGEREDSNVYIRMKKKIAGEIGITARHVKFPRTITQEELLLKLNDLNNDVSVHGVIVQLPLDSATPIDANLITNTVSPAKDVDGIHDENAGKLSHGQLEGFFIACTPYGCLDLIKKSGVEIKGSRAVVIGRSKIVGMPMAQLLIWHHATVTICHSRTKDLKSVVREADIIVAAVGQAQMVKKDWVKPGAVVIDCGINSIPDSTKASGSRLVGDVDFDGVKEVASYITPVPGGVGPMTVIMLMKNTVIAAKRALASAQRDDFDCPESFGFFPHHRSCDKYWACENGTATLKLCGNGLVFDDVDPLREGCAYPFSVNCGDRTELEPPISTPNCPRLYGVYANQDNCRVFYSCWNGEASRYECPPGLAYDAEQRVCVWADLVERCDQLEVAEGFVCPDPSDVDQPGLYSRHAHPTDCRKFYVCMEGTARPYGCSLGTVFNVDTLQCDEPENVPGCENYYGDLDVKALKKSQG